MAEYFIQLKDNNGNLLYPRTRWAVILDKPTFVTPEQLALKQDLLTSTNAGDGITISNGVISVNAGADFEFVNGQLHLKGLPTATNGQVLTSDGQGGVTWTTPGGTYVLPLAASGTRGGIQIGYYDDYANKRYGVKLSNEKAYVEVPWTDTTYSAGNGLTLTGTTFSIKLATNSGLSVDGNGLTIASGAIPTHTSDLVNDGSDGTSTYVEGADLATVATSGDYNDLLNKPTIPDAMQFKGSLGTGGTITTLPTASTANSGYTYKVITAGIYAGQPAKVGDLFVSNGTEWVRIPSGDEPSGTVTSVAIANGGALTVSGSPITSSGTITIAHADTSSQASVANSGRTYIQSVTLDTYGHVTALTSATETVTNTTYSFRTGTTAGAFDVKASTASDWTSVPIYGLKAFAYKDVIAVSDLPISATTPISFSSTGMITHDTSGVTGTTTGDSGATRTLTYGGTFVVPYITYNSYGHITATANKTLTLPAQYVHPTYTEAAAAAKKIGRDATGHVVIGGNITAADVGAITLSSLSGTNPILYDGAGVFSLSYDTNTLGLTAGDMPQLKVKDNGHSHTASNISDFSSSVRGLIGATAPITYSSSTGKVSLTIGAGLTTSSNALIVDTSWLSGEIDTALDGYATEDWVTGQNYITLNSLSADSPITYSAGTFGHATTLTTAKTLGLYKVAVNTFGHITNTAAVVKDDITNLGIPGTDTNTTYSLNVNGTGVNTGKVGLVSANPASTTWYVIPYATTAGSTPLATAANQLNSSVDGNPIGAGSSTNPVYFSNGLPVACGFTVETSVPANAVFTDTNTWRPIKYNTTTLNDASTTLEFIAGSNTSLSFSNGKLTISATNTTYSFSSPLQIDTETNTVSILVGTTGGVAAYGHTHPTSIATTSDNVNLNLNYSGKYKLTTGGTDFVFTLPAIYSLPAATSGALGGIKIGYTTDATNRNYAVQLSSEKAFVNVPWTDTTYTGTAPIKISNANVISLDFAQDLTNGQDGLTHANTVTSGTAGEGGSTRTLAFGGTFNVPSVTYDGHGHITSKGSVTLTLPANPNVDEKVKLTAKTDNVNYRIILGPASPTSGSTYDAYYSNTTNKVLTFNPSTGNLAATQLNGVTIGSSPKFTDTTYSAGNGLDLSSTTFSVKTIQGSGIIVDTNGVSVENPVPTHLSGDGNYLIWNGTSTAWGSLPTGSTSQAGILQLGTGSAQAAQGNHTHAWNSLTRSSTTAGQAIVSTSTANGWELKTLGSAAYTASTVYAAATHDHVWTDITNRPSSLPNTYSLNIKVNTETTNFVSYDGSSAKTLTIAPSTTNGAFTISDGTTTKTIQLNGTFTDTTYSLTTSGNNIILKRGSTNQDTITAPYATSAGSATTAGTFASAASVTLTGDTTGTASSTKGWSVATTTGLITSAYAGTTEGAIAALTGDPGTGKVKFYYNLLNQSTGSFPTTNNANAILSISKHAGNYVSQLGFSSNGKLYYKSCSNQTLANATWYQIITSNDLRISEIDIDGNTLTIYDQNGDDRQYSPTFTDTKVKLTAQSTSGNYPLIFGPTSITSGTAYEAYYNTNIKINPSTGNLQATQLNGVTIGNSPKFTDTTYTSTAPILISNANVISLNYAQDLTNGQDGLTHANSTTSVSTQGLRKIAYDGHGHITGSTAVTKADIPALDYLPLTGGTLTPPASTGGSGSSARAPLVIDCSAMSSGAWTEGIRIKPAASGWTSFMLCGTDNTTNINSSANSWSMHTYQGKFGIYRNGSDIATSTMLMGIECSNTGVWTLKTNTSATTSLEIRNTYSSANNHVLADFFATALTNSASTTTSGAFIRVGRDASSYNCADIAFHYTGVNSPTNYLGFGLYGHSYVLNVVGTERVGIKNTAPISELDVTGGISWSSKATSQYNATDDCVEFIFV